MWPVSDFVLSLLQYNNVCFMKFLLIHLWPDLVQLKPLENYLQLNVIKGVIQRLLFSWYLQQASAEHLQRWCERTDHWANTTRRVGPRVLAEGCTAPASAKFGWRKNSSGRREGGRNWMGVGCPPSMLILIQVVRLAWSWTRCNPSKAIGAAGTYPVAMSQMCPCLSETPVAP